MLPFNTAVHDKGKGLCFGEDVVKISNNLCVPDKLIGLVNRITMSGYWLSSIVNISDAPLSTIEPVQADLRLPDPASNYGLSGALPKNGGTCPAGRSIRCVFLHHLASIQHDDLVGVLHRVQPMRDHDQRLVGGEGVECLLHQLFVLRVNAAALRVYL